MSMLWVGLLLLSQLPHALPFVSLGNSAPGELLTFFPGKIPSSCSRSTQWRAVPPFNKRPAVAVNLNRDESAWLGLDFMQEKTEVFPTAVDQVITQASESIVAALDDGLFRIRLQINTAEFDPKRYHESQSIMAFVNTGKHVALQKMVFSFRLPSLYLAKTA
jgi:hypothetical protein